MVPLASLVFQQPSLASLASVMVYQAEPSSVASMVAQFYVEQFPTPRVQLIRSTSLPSFYHFPFHHLLSHYVILTVPPSPSPPLSSENMIVRFSLPTPTKIARSAVAWSIILCDIVIAYDGNSWRILQDYLKHISITHQTWQDRQGLFALVGISPQLHKNCFPACPTKHAQ